MVRKYILMMIAIAAIVPVSVLASDQTDIEMEAKKKLGEIIAQIQEDVNRATTQEEINRLKKLLAGAQDFKEAVNLGEQLKMVPDGEKAQLETKLMAKLEALKEHAGDRYVHTEVTEGDLSDQESNKQSSEISAQSAWLPKAYASNSLTDFEFGTNYGGCGSDRYNMEFIGVIDNSKKIMDVEWGFPHHMFVDNKDDSVLNDCIYIDYVQSDLYHYGFDTNGVE